MFSATVGAPGVLTRKDVRVPVMSRARFRLTPTELRQQAQACAQASRDETEPRLKRAFANAALALAQLSECIERDSTPREEGGKSVRE